MKRCHLKNPKLLKKILSKEYRSDGYIYRYIARYLDNSLKVFSFLFFFSLSLSAGKLTARCSGNFKLLPRLPVRVGWTLELEDIHGESFGE